MSDDVGLHCLPRLAPRTRIERNEVVATIPADGFWALATGAGSVWATTHGDATLLRIDPATNSATTFPAPRKVVHGVAVLDGTVWTVATDRDTGGGELFGLDPASGEVVSHIPEGSHDRSPPVSARCG